MTKTPRSVNKVGNHERTTNGISVRYKFIVNNGNPKPNTIKKQGEEAEDSWWKGTKYRAKQEEQTKV